MVSDLLQKFIPAAWVDELDLATLEKCNGSYISDDLRDHTDDLIWRVRWGHDWLYVYLLLEFQSSIDRWMVVRIQTYLGFLYQDLIRTRQLSKAGLLPPVLPIVLYNGADPWNAARALDDLIEPAPLVLHRYRPQQAYFLLDEQHVAEQGDLPQRNLSAALFRLEASRTPAEVLTILRALVEWLAAPEQAGLRRAFSVWLNRVFLPKRLAGVEFESMTDSHEVRNMLSNRVESWTEQWKQGGAGFGAGSPRDAPPTHPPGSPPIRSRNRGTDRAAPDSDCRSPTAGGPRRCAYHLPAPLGCMSCVMHDPRRPPATHNRSSTNT